METRGNLRRAADGQAALRRESRLLIFTPSTRRPSIPQARTLCRRAPPCHLQPSSSCLTRRPHLHQLQPLHNPTSVLPLSQTPRISLSTQPRQRSFANKSTSPSARGPRTTFKNIQTPIQHQRTKRQERTSRTFYDLTPLQGPLRTTLDRHDQARRTLPKRWS